MEQLSKFESADFGLLTKCQLFIAYVLQKGFDLLDERLRTWVTDLLQHSDVYCYYIAHEEGVADDRLALFNEIMETLSEACTIYVAVGEMGHQLMEHPKFISGLQNAAERNGATIEIVHGPNVDPQTRSIFQLAKEGSVVLHQSCRYDRHHFVLIERENGSWGVLDERQHNETLWYIDDTGDPCELFQGSGRFYYLMKHSIGRAHRLKQEFEVRKRTSVSIVEHPGISSPQDITSIESLLAFILSIPFKMILQPWAIYQDAAFDVSLWQRRDCEDSALTEATDLLAVSQYAEPAKMLPEEAQQWLDQQLIALDGNQSPHNSVDSDHSHSTIALEGASALRIQAGTSLGVFRDMHFMRYPESSVASLAIDDDLFLDLIWNKILTVCELEERLKMGSHLAFRNADKGAATDEQNVATLSEAVSEWHKEGSE